MTYSEHNVCDYGADSTGERDSAPAINAALARIAAKDADICILIPPGRYLLKSPVVLRLNGTLVRSKHIRAHGATLVSAVQSPVPAFLIRATGEVRCLRLSGLRMEGGSAETSMLTLDGSGPGNALYNVVIDDLTIEQTAGMALNIISVFESRIANAWLQSTSKTADCCLIQSSADAPALGNLTSSLTIDNMTTRGGLNGLETDLATGEVRVINSTFLTAQQFGAKVNFCCGVVLINNHAEDNWLGAAGQTVEQAGIMVACEGIVLGGYSYSPPGGKQGSAVRAYALAGKTISVDGVDGQGMLALVYADGQPGGVVRLAGQCATAHVTSGAPTVVGRP